MDNPPRKTVGVNYEPPPRIVQQGPEAIARFRAALAYFEEYCAKDVHDFSEGAQFVRNHRNLLGATGELYRCRMCGAERVVMIPGS